jgi:hypothetical protein
MGRRVIEVIGEYLHGFQLQKRHFSLLAIAVLCLSSTTSIEALSNEVQFYEAGQPSHGSLSEPTR